MHEFTRKSESVLEKTRDFAIKHNYTYIGTEHLLYGLVKEQSGIAGKILSKQKVTAKFVEEKILQIDGKEENKESKEVEPTFTPRAKKVIENSIKESKKVGSNYVGTEHILLALMKETDSIAVRILIEANINPEKVFMELVKYITDENYSPSIYKNHNTPTLNMYTENVTELAKKNKLDEIIGMEDYLTRVIQILTRRTKNNVLIIGEAGVGKTSLVYALARTIAKENKIHLDKTILELDISSMLAGAKYRGDFEERLKKCVVEAKNEGNILLYIEDMRNIINSGNTEGSLDAANILKPYLSKGDVQIIGTCTIEEYVKYIEKDMSLNRLFQVVEVKEPTKEETLNILKGIKSKYEKYHNVEIIEEAIKESIELADRYIHSKKMPDKVIDIIDETCSKVRTEGRNRLESTDVEQVVAKMVNIPVEKISKSEKEKLITLEERLEENVIGQKEAVRKIANVIKRNRLGIRDAKKPIGVFLFTGPTGVGKTELVKVLARELLDSESKIIRLDMSEYMEPHSVSKLIGAPPGYIGYGELGTLTEKVRRNPYSIILFDEIEKAHSEVYNVLLQLFDDGRLTDSKGRTVDFNNTICIMTSNIGARNIIEEKTLGFKKEITNSERYESMYKEVMKEVKNKFSPEFLNRLDDVIVFNKLDELSIEKITKLMLNKTKERITKYGFKIEFKDNLIKYVSLTGYDAKNGARPIIRTIKTKIEDELAEYILKTNISDNDRIKIGYSKSKDRIEIAKVKSR
ncbi:MAG: ATP-dependent Clp protease ATP-binding subunit [Clostridia bacterium]|nr:ATP-dependent Clp protease ATP-binding subunit [Clostridia bacterium]